MLEPKLVPAEDEEAYRKHYLRTDMVQVIVIIGVLGLASLVYVRGDLASLGHDSRVMQVFANRIVAGAALTGASVALGRATTSRAFDRALALMLMTLVASTAHVFYVRPPNVVAYLPINLLLVTLLWFVMPGPLVMRGLAAFAISLVTARSGHFAELPPIATHALGLAHAITHLIGLPISIRMARLRRDRFRAQLAAERTQAQLLAEKERAEELARAKSDFLATMSHEFRTPMNAVLGLSEVLLHSHLPPMQHEQVQTIHRNADGLLVLLNDILEHAKLDAGRLTLDPTSVDLHELTCNAVAAVQHRAEEKHLTLTTTLPPDLPRHVVVDGTRLRQILVNLLSNAVKFTEHGAVTLEVCQRNVEKDKLTLVFRVTDTGMGIAEENIERIFSAFEQATPQRLGNQGGTGLGLSISRRLAQQMGGTLTVSSTLGKGSTFEFVVPTRTAEAPKARKSTRPVPLGSATELRILIAEDNTTNQSVAVAMLEQLGYAADIVDNGQLALEAAQKTPYDVILMDRHMPGIDGLEATRRIRTRLGSKPYIVAMTASAFAEDRAVCLDAGMDDFIAKPIRLADLREALVRARTRDVSPNSVRHASLPPSQPEPTLLAFDPAPLDQLRALAELGEPGFLEKLCEDFIRDSGTHIKRFPEWITQGDAETLKRTTHGMKSAAASLGAVAMSRTCAEIEKLSESTPLETCLPLVARLEGEFDAAKDWLKQELEKH